MQDRVCSEYFTDSVLRTLKYMTPAALKVKQNKNQTTHLNAYWVPGGCSRRNLLSPILPFPFKVGSEAVKSPGLTMELTKKF